MSVQQWQANEVNSNPVPTKSGRFVERNWLAIAGGYMDWKNFGFALTAFAQRNSPSGLVSNSLQRLKQNSVVNPI
jgi:hypothetical protein